MNSRNNLTFRLELSKGFLAEAEQDYTLQRWRSCVDNAQLTVENSGKAILAVFGIISKTHEPAKVISKLIYSGQLKGGIVDKLKALLPDILALGEDEHFMTVYGDETTMKLPWEIYNKDSAAAALSAARNIIQLSQQIAQENVVQ